MNIYVGNLPYSTTDTDLAEMFGEYGEVTRATVVMDRELDRSKGFGFVEMADDAAGAAAIEALNGNDVGGRRLRVDKATPRPDRGGGRRPRS